MILMRRSMSIRVVSLMMNLLAFWGATDRAADICWMSLSSSGLLPWASGFRRTALGQLWATAIGALGFPACAEVLRSLRKKYYESERSFLHICVFLHPFCVFFFVSSSSTLEVYLLGP